MLKERIAEATRLATIGETIIADKFTEEYTDTYNKHQLGIRKAGIQDKMPKKLEFNPANHFVDENGKIFDTLRGRGSLSDDIAKYMKDFGGDFNQVTEWADSQGSSSWSTDSTTLKYFIGKSRGQITETGKAGAKSNAFWQGGDKTLKRARKNYETRVKVGKKYEESFISMMAFNYELMDKVEATNNDKQTKTWTTYRTESNNFPTRYKLKPGDKGKTAKRGIAESGSMITPVRAVAGAHLTIQKVPYHRIVQTYLMDQDSEVRSEMFMGDIENEVVFITEDVKFDYEGAKTHKELLEISLMTTDLDDPLDIHSVDYGSAKKYPWSDDDDDDEDLSYLNFDDEDDDDYLGSSSSDFLDFDDDDDDDDELDASTAALFKSLEAKAKKSAAKDKKKKK